MRHKRLPQTSFDLYIVHKNRHLIRTATSAGKPTQVKLNALFTHLNLWWLGKRWSVIKKFLVMYSPESGDKQMALLQRSWRIVISPNFESENCTRLISVRCRLGRNWSGEHYYSYFFLHIKNNYHLLIYLWGYFNGMWGLWNPTANKNGLLLFLFINKSIAKSTDCRSGNVLLGCEFKVTGHIKFFCIFFVRWFLQTAASLYRSEGGWYGISDQLYGQSSV